MKKIKHITSIVLIFMSLYAVADIGYCFKYKVKFKLSDNSEIEGYYLFPTYEDFYKNINSIDTILKITTSLWTDSITVYKEILTIDNIRISDKIYSIDVIPENSQTKICLKKIIKSEIIEISPCCKGTQDSYDNQYYIGCCLAVIEELTNDEISKLKDQKPEISLIYRECPDDIMNSLVVFSYNKDIREDELLNQLEEKYCEEANRMDGDYFEKYDIFKSWTRKEDIIVFKHCWW